MVVIALVTALVGAGIFPALTKAKTRVEANVFLPNVGYSIASLSSLETTLGVRFTAAMWYQDWSSSFDPTPANNLHASGHLPELTWEPQMSGNGIAYDDVIAGHYDAYLTNFAQGVAGLGYPIRVSLAPEMNTDWTPWGMGLHGNNPTNFKAFWQHVVGKFREAGASNVVWVWSPNVTPSNANQLYGGNLGNLYPGDSFVDLMGLDGYNWGSSQSWSVWQSFSQVFQSSYQQLLGVSSKNIILMEVASAEAGGSKAAWITDMFSQLQSGYSRIQGFTWFNINKETDWRINSSPGAQAAFTAGFNGTATSSGSGSASSGASAAGMNNSAAKQTFATAKPSNPTAAPTPTANAATAPDPSTAPSPADQKYPVSGVLPTKLAGNLVSAATVKQLSSPEVGVIFATILAGLLAIAFLASRRYRSLHASPLLPLGLAVERVERWFGIGHIDSVLHRRHFAKRRWLKARYFRE